MRLQVKLLLSLTLATAAGGVVLLNLLEDTLLPRFQALEQTNLERGLRLVEHQIELELEALSETCIELSTAIRTPSDDADGDWGPWRVAPSPRELELAEVAFAASYSDTGECAWSSALLAPTEAQTLADELLALREIVVDGPLGGRPVQGLLSTSHGPYLLAACAANGSSSGLGGVLVLARPLDTEPLTSAAEIQGLVVVLQPIEHPRAELGSEPALISTALAGLAGVPVLELVVQSGEPFADLGRRSVRAALGAAGLLALALLLTALFLVERGVLHPVRQLLQQTRRVSREGDSIRTPARLRRDEFGLLAREFDSAWARVQRSRRELTDTARRAGMSELAALVLHDVGNLVNSLGVTAEQMTEKLESGIDRDLGRAAVVLMQHLEDLPRYLSEDERGRELPRFLMLALGQLGDERAELLLECDRMRELAALVSSLVVSQREFAEARDVVEEVYLEELISEVALVVAPGWEADGLNLRLALDCPPQVRLNRHKVIRVLVALLRNACEAVICKGDGGAVDLRVRVTPYDMIRFEIQDEGVGFEALEPAEMFRSGTSTKGPGRGFGLHTAANLAREMGGSVSASPGPGGEGAVFVFEIPVAEASATAALAQA